MGMIGSSSTYTDALLIKKTGKGDFELRDLWRGSFLCGDNTCWPYSAENGKWYKRGRWAVRLFAPLI